TSAQRSAPAPAVIPCTLNPGETTERSASPTWPSRSHPLPPSARYIFRRAPPATAAFNYWGAGKVKGTAPAAAAAPADTPALSAPPRDLAAELAPLCPSSQATAPCAITSLSATTRNRLTLYTTPGSISPALPAPSPTLKWI